MSDKLKVLITGITGQIGQYVKEVYEEDNMYEIWGISRNPSSNRYIIEMELRNKERLEHLILNLKPDIIIHLAGISNLEDCANDPILAIEINSHVTVDLCEIIHKNNLKCKFFNASSSEIYKGHNNYIVEEGDKYYMPNHPYGISKLLAHNMVEYYRNTFKLPFSNGIIFTTESHRRTPNFLFKKVANHIKAWKTGDRNPLIVGCLKSYRTILHAYDVAQAIKRIMECERGDTYLICGDEHICVEALIVRMFELAKIPVIISENTIKEAETGETIVEIKGSMRGIVSSIHGKCEKIKRLGFKPRYNLDGICLDHLA